MRARRWIKVFSRTIDLFCMAKLKEGGRVVEDSGALFNAGFPVRIVQHYKIDDSHVAEVHLDKDDLWLCLGGEATFICGGRLAEPIKQFVPNELTFISPSIIGGETIVLKRGDWFLIPAGQPHQPKTKGVAHLAIVKIPAREGCIQLDYLP